MNLLDTPELKSFQDLFSKKKLVNEGEIASRNISPSKMYCPVYEVFKIQGIPMAGEEESFESRGYAESGNSRHQAIQKFLIDHPDVEWVDPGKYVGEKGLPFIVKPSRSVLQLIEKYPNISEEEAKNLLGEYEVNLVHKTQPLSFKLDGLIKYLGEYYILEIKTIGKKDFTRVPLDKHQAQGKTYSFLLKIDKVAWVYECREDFKVKVAFQLIREGERQQMRDILNSIILNRENPKALERNLQKCTYCRYKPHCLEVFLAKKEDIPF